MSGGLGKRKESSLRERIEQAHLMTPTSAPPLENAFLCHSHHAHHPHNHTGTRPLYIAEPAWGGRAWKGMEEGLDTAVAAPASSQQQEQEEQEEEESSQAHQQASTSGSTATAPPATPPLEATDEASDAASALAGLALTSAAQGAEEEGSGKGSIAAALDTSQDGTPPSTTDDNDTSTSTASSSSQPAAPPPSSPASAAATSTGTTHTGKVKVQLMAVGRAPRLAQSKFIVQAKDSFRALFPVLRRLLQLREDQALFVFVNSAFAPAPEDKFGDLFQCFGKTGTLIVNYSLDEAWG